MQSKTSFFNKALFKKNLSRTWIVGLLYFIFLVISLPISYIIQVADFENTWEFSSGYTKQIMLYSKFTNMPAGGMACVISIIVAGITFWYLFNKRDNYMMHSFPVSRRSLYFTGLLSSLLVTIVPVVLNSIITSIVAIAEGAYAFDAIWYWTLVVIVSTCLFLSIAMFALMSSGQIITAIIFYWIFNYLYGMIQVAFSMTASTLLFGLGNAMGNMDYSPLSPVLYITRNCRVYTTSTADDYGVLQTFSYEFLGIKYLVIYAIAAIVITIIAYQMYRFKKLETVHDFISAPFLKPIFTVGMSFFISMVAGSMVAAMVDAAKLQTYNAKFVIAIVSALIIGVIIFYATQMMIEKTVRVFKLKRFGFCLLYSIASFAVLMCIRMDVFKVEDRVPDGDEIEWVGISANYVMVFSDEDEINTIRELHKNFLADKKELRDVNLTYSQVDGSMLSIKYKLKNGKYVYREYSVVDTQSDQVSAEYVAATEPIVDFLNVPTRIKEHILGNIWDNCDVTEMSFSEYTYDPELNDYIYSYEDFGNYTENELKAINKKVYEAFLKDIDEGNALQTSFKSMNYSADENLYNDFSFTIQNKQVPYFSDEDTYWNYEYGTMETFERPIYPSLSINCTNTLQALYDQGYYTSEDQIVTWGEYYNNLGYGDGDYYY